MRFLLVALSLFSLSSPSSAEELLRKISFAEAADSGALRGGEPADGEILKVPAAPGQPFQALLELGDPGISSPVYALKGRVRYEGVEGDGYLQLDNDFGDRGTFFTKSLATSGPLKKISGDSDWREFVLPFYAYEGDRPSEATLLPEKLSLALYLPVSGTVWIDDLALYQYAAGEDPLQSAGQWIDNRSAILFGAFGGALIGIWGAVIGVVSSRGKAKRFVIGSSIVLFVIGIASLGAGAVAFGLGQPYAIYYPLLLVGIILVALIGVLRRPLAARYEQLELQKMRSMDVR